MFLVPFFNAVLAVLLMYFLFAFWPSHPFWLGAIETADHFFRRWQWSIDSRCERMNQLWPFLVPEPQHR